MFGAHGVISLKILEEMKTTGVKTRTHINAWTRNVEMVQKLKEKTAKGIIEGKSGSLF